MCLGQGQPPSPQRKIQHTADRQDAGQRKTTAGTQEECGAKNVCDPHKWGLLLLRTPRIEQRER